MTKQEALEAVKEIEAVIDDDEAAHSKEEDLRNQFISDIAKRRSKLGEIAQIVLSTNDLDFARW